VTLTSLEACSRPYQNRGKDLLLFVLFLLIRVRLVDALHLPISSSHPIWMLLLNGSVIRDFFGDESSENLFESS